MRWYKIERKKKEEKKGRVSSRRTKSKKVQIGGRLMLDQMGMMKHVLGRWCRVH